MSRRTRTAQAPEAAPAPVDADLADMLGDTPAAGPTPEPTPVVAAGPTGTVRVRNLHPDTVWLSAGRMEAGEEADVSVADAELLIARGLAELVP